MLVDLPKDEHGEDAATSALELNLLSLAGCITTIFALVAHRRRLTFESLEVDLEGNRPRGAPTLSSVGGRAVIVTASDPEAVETALRITLRTCPVGVLYERAGIPVTVRSVVLAPGQKPEETAAAPPAPATEELLR